MSTQVEHVPQKPKRLGGKALGIESFIPARMAWMSGSGFFLGSAFFFGLGRVSYGVEKVIVMQVDVAAEDVVNVMLPGVVVVKYIKEPPL